ncbi:centriolar protein POC1 [Paragonimus westermani]|uniref:Centriolar protein POC1 n=1 Tax=Paragonimus westermani TaxID=34504 RepID=A0A5J4NQR0_9TREM|nr:centriolar protein POC1 [Paragonimus westermani]
MVGLLSPRMLTSIFIDIQDDPTLQIHFKGHRDAITCVDFNPNGKQLGESITFRAHTAAIRWVDLSSDGLRMCTASADKSLKVWNPHRQKFLFSLNQHVNWVRCCRFSPDSRLIISSSDDKTIKLWDCENQTCVHTFHESGGFASHLDFHPSGNCFAAGSTNSSVKLWDLRMSRLLQHYDAHTGPVNKVSCHPNGHFLLSASDDATLKIFDLLEGRPLYTLQGHTGPVTAATFSASGDHFASGGNDEQVFLWRTNFDTQLCSTSNKEASRSNGHRVSDAESARRRTSKKISQALEATVVDQVQEPVNTPGTSSAQAVDLRSENRASSTASVECHHTPRIHGHSIPSYLPLYSTANTMQNTKSSAEAAGDQQNIPPSLTTTLEHMLSQLNILTQTVSLIEQRLTLVETRVREEKNDK